MECKRSTQSVNRGDGLIENWWGEHHRQAANVRARAAERDVYQAQVDAAELHRNNYNDARLAAIEAQDAHNEHARQQAEAQAAAEIVAAAQQAGIDAALLQERLLNKKALNMWRNKVFKKHIDKRIALKKLGLPAGVDPNAVIYIMEKGLSLEGHDLKVWVQKIGDKVIQLEDQQNQFFSTAGNAAKGEAKEGDPLAKANPVTPDPMFSPVKQIVTREQRALLLEEGRTDPLTNTGQIPQKAASSPAAKAQDQGDGGGKQTPPGGKGGKKKGNKGGSPGQKTP